MTIVLESSSEDEDFAVGEEEEEVPEEYFIVSCSSDGVDMMKSMNLRRRLKGLKTAVLVRRGSTLRLEMNTLQRKPKKKRKKRKKGRTRKGRKTRRTKRKRKRNSTI